MHLTPGKLYQVADGVYLQYTTEVNNLEIIETHGLYIYEGSIILILEKLEPVIFHNGHVNDHYCCLYNGQKLHLFIYNQHISHFFVAIKE